VPLLTLVETLRLSAAIQLVLLATLVLRDHRRSRLTPATTLSLGSVSCYLLLPMLLQHDAPKRVLEVVSLGALAVPFAFWATTRLHFDDSFAWKPAHFGVFAALWVARAATAWHVASAVIAMVVVADALRRIHSGASSDLLLSRLRLRYIVLCTTGIYALLVLVAEATTKPGSPVEAVLSALNAVGLLLVVLAVSALVLRLEPDFLKAASPRDAATPASGLKQKLDRLIEEDHVFRQEGLTIGALAARLGEQEYKVRQLVNAHLGFRNFSAFLNHLRVGEARKLLADPRQKHLGVAEIAYRLGYSSLGPFNRAFKELTGQTPTEFRKAALGDEILADSEIGQPPSKTS